MIFPEHFYFTSQTLLPKGPNTRLNTIFNGKQHIETSKQAESDLLIPWEMVMDGLLAELNGFDALVLKLVGIIKQFLLTHIGQDHT